MPEETTKDQQDQAHEENVENLEWDVSDENAADVSLEEQVEQLTKKLAEQDEIVKRAQSDYFRTKMEFDEYVTRADVAKLWFELDGLIKALEKVLPFVNQLATMMSNTPEELASNSWVEWVHLLHRKMITDLWLLWVTPIVVEIWTDPDFTIHIPIGVEETDDESLKNKIIKEIEGWFIYEKWDIKKVVMPAKVMVWS